MTTDNQELTAEERLNSDINEFHNDIDQRIFGELKRRCASALQHARKEERAAIACWHEDRRQGGHCGEATSEIIIRQQRNEWHEQAANAIRSMAESWLTLYRKQARRSRSEGES